MASSHSSSKAASTQTSSLASSSPTSVSTSQSLRSFSTSLRAGSPSSSSSQIPSLAPTSSQSAPLSHKPAVIAAIAASIAAALLCVIFAIFLYRRCRARQRVGSITPSAHSFLRPTPGDDNDKGWRDSGRSTLASGWADQPSPRTVPIPLRVEGVQTRQSVGSFAGKTPHYTVSRAHTSVADLYGFGQDVAWQEAHYEDPLPVGAPPDHPAIGMIPPTPPSGVIHHNIASATPILRSHSAASSIPSEYSTTSMTLPDPAVLPHVALPQIQSSSMIVPFT
ncbi:hypothetical protein DFH09DRAFT_1411984 [Mycena vulgaris]|nr:hypothetical protein DFH09DRAFT_1411984 [Mycena vulgaris]